MVDRTLLKDISIDKKGMAKKRLVSGRLSEDVLIEKEVFMEERLIRETLMEDTSIENEVVNEKAADIRKLRICKRCLLMDQNKSKEKEIVYKYIAELSSKEKSDEDTFKSRLDTCRQCKWLEQATCNACGCFVEVRAAVKKNKCPYKKW